MIAFNKFDIQYYVNLLAKKKYFAFAGYSDAEWFSILKYDIGKATGLGQILDEHTGERLFDVILRRYSDPNFLFAVPFCFWEWEDFINAKIGEKIELLLKAHNIDMAFYERDIVLDELAQEAGLYPFIHQLQQMKTVVIGNKDLARLDFLGYDHYIKISCPNLHLEEGGIERAVENAQHYGQSAVYLVSAGMSAALIIDQLWGTIPNSFFIDCGSIWDAFVGIGAQREWRKKLYDNPAELERWKHDNLYGKS